MLMDMLIFVSQCSDFIKRFSYAHFLTKCEPRYAYKHYANK